MSVVQHLIMYITITYFPKVSVKLIRTFIKFFIHTANELWSDFGVN